jgi:hypothetical protein
MGSSALLDLPYPEDTDPLGQVAAAIEGLANAVDGQYKAWANLTHSVTSGSVRWCVRGRTVFIECNVAMAALVSGAGLTVVTAANGVPAAYRPNQSLYTGVARMNAGTLLGLVLTPTDGSIQVVNVSGVNATSAQFRVCYPMELP